MKFFRQLLFPLLMVAARAEADLPADPVEYAAWETKMLDSISIRRSEPLEIAAPKLGEYVHKLSFPWNRELGERRVFFAARDALLSTPGHAEYFGNKIRSDRELRKAGRGHEVKGGTLWDFETLALLPSPETVRVLGSFLDDEEDRIPDEVFRNNPSAHVAPIGANNLLAARALTRLGIVQPPLQMKPEDMFYDDIHPWRLWFAQVKAGTRTFRFEGDPQEYSLAGPVGEAKDSQSDHASRTPTVPPAAVTPSDFGTSAHNPLPVIPLVGAIVALAFALWLAIRKKRKSS